MSYETLEYASSFASEACPEGFVCVAGNTLRILTCERLGEVFNQHSMKLSYTPRKACLLKGTKNFVVVEGDHNCGQRQLKEGVDNMQTDEGEEGANEMPDSIYGVQRAGDGMWAGCVRVVDPLDKETLQVIALGDNECPFSVTSCSFHDRKDETFVLVGVAEGLKLGDRGGVGSILCYSVSGNRLTLMHKTPIDGIPRAICPFQGRVLVGCGSTLRIYDLGKKKLLRKCENKHFPNMIVSVRAPPSPALTHSLFHVIHSSRKNPTPPALNEPTSCIGQKPPFFKCQVFPLCAVTSLSCVDEHIL